MDEIDFEMGDHTNTGWAPKKEDARAGIEAEIIKGVV